MDDLVKRLRRCFNGLEGLQTDQGDYGVLAEAAAALAEAQATIARQQVMLDRALESNGDMQAEIARLREALRPFAQEHSWVPHSRFKIVLAGPEGDITGADLDRARAALEAKHG